MSIRFLKIKLKSLAAEARIIRLEEKRSVDPLREALYLHRIGVVRVEARATHLAYGLLRGRPYERIEARARTVPPWDKVRAMLKKYGPPESVTAFDAWLMAYREVRKAA